MVKIPKIECLVRSPVRSHVYKAGLQPQVRICAGFLIGTLEDYNPTFDMALVCCSLVDANNFAQVIPELEKAVPACRATAEFANAQPLGVFAAWDTYWLKSKNAYLGALVDFAREKKIYYVASFMTDGGETIWGISLYHGGRFPHEALEYKMIGKRSELPNHNPRRIKSFWEHTLKETLAKKPV